MTEQGRLMLPPTGLWNVWARVRILIWVSSPPVSSTEMFCSKDDWVLKLSSFKVIQLIIDSLSDDNRLYISINQHFVELFDSLTLSNKKESQSWEKMEGTHSALSQSKSVLMSAAVGSCSNFCRFSLTVRCVGHLSKLHTITSFLWKILK